MRPVGLGTARFAVLVVWVMGAVSLASSARAESLADVRASLVDLRREFQALMTEVRATEPRPQLPDGGDAIARLVALERELQRLTGSVEELEFRFSRMQADVTNRFGDLEFRVCELDPACNIATLEQTIPVGGVVPKPTDPTSETIPQMAVGESADFTGAVVALEARRYHEAAARFARFRDSYPGSPFEQEALLGRGQALEGAGDIREAARSYLAAYSGYPDGRLAGKALVALGLALGKLGKVPEGCVTLFEVGARYPDTPAQAEAEIALQSMGCL
ncbi:MAG: tol-pal system protein [Primorskyibacter sp.]